MCVYVNLRKHFFTGSAGVDEWTALSSFFYVSFRLVVWYKFFFFFGDVR